MPPGCRVQRAVPGRRDRSASRQRLPRGARVRFPRCPLPVRGAPAEPAPPACDARAAPRRARAVHPPGWPCAGTSPPGSRSLRDRRGASSARCSRPVPRPRRPRRRVARGRAAAARHPSAAPTRRRARLRATRPGGRRCGAAAPRGSAGRAALRDRRPLRRAPPRARRRGDRRRRRATRSSRALRHRPRQRSGPGSRALRRGPPARPRRRRGAAAAGRAATACSGCSGSSPAPCRRPRSRRPNRRRLRAGRRAAGRCGRFRSRSRRAGAAPPRRAPAGCSRSRQLRGRGPRKSTRGNRTRGTPSTSDPPLCSGPAGADHNSGRAAPGLESARAGRIGSSMASGAERADAEE